MEAYSRWRVSQRHGRVVRVADIDPTVDSDSDYATEDSDEGE
jgi:hypothetical protein